jgi:hypothetical protein
MTGRSAVNQVNDSAPGMPGVPGQAGCADCVNSRHLRVLAKNLDSRGLHSRLITHPAGAHDHEHAGTITVTNPAAPERGEARIADDGTVTWEYSGKLDDTGVSTICDDLTNALRATGLRHRPGPPS